jgi:hypothetical protein
MSRKGNNTCGVNERFMWENSSLYIKQGVKYKDDYLVYEI